MRGRRSGASWVGAALALTLGCDAPVQPEAVGSTGEAVEPEPSTDAAPPDVGTEEPALRCPTPAGHSGRPQSIDEAVEHIAALPGPVDVPCLLESFARPLPVMATSSVFSAQPGQGDANPRLFVFFDGLILSFATTGHGAQLVEFAEFIGPTTTVKAELELPLEPDTLELAMAFERVQDGGDGTVCRLCHRNEVSAPAVHPQAFASDALAPRSDTIIDLQVVRMFAQSCDPSEDADRCAIFDAVFGPGEVVPGGFDPQIQTIFDYE